MHKIPLLACMTCSLLVSSPPFAANASTTPDAIDACSLLDPAVITEAIGLPVLPGVRNDAGITDEGSYSSTCLWVIKLGGTGAEDASAPLGGRSFVILNAFQWPAASGLAGTFLKAFHDAAATGEIPSPPEPRSFGDQALWWGDGLAVARGDVSFGISVFGPLLAPGHPGEYEERLAPHVLRKLDAAR